MKCKINSVVIYVRKLLELASFNNTIGLSSGAEVTDVLLKLLKDRIRSLKHISENDRVRKALKHFICVKQHLLQLSMNEQVTDRL